MCSQCLLLLVLVDHFGKTHEGLFNVVSCLYTCDDVFYFVFGCPIVDFIVSNSLLEIAFITDEDHDGFICFCATEVIPLFFDVFEGRFARKVKDHHDTMTTFEVS